MSGKDAARECLLPLPWLLAALAFWSSANWLPALACEFMFFLVALRLNHEAVHFNVGLSRRGHQLILHILSTVMLGSNHSVAFNHLRHHAYINTPADIEGKCGRMTLAGVITYGPHFPYECHHTCWTKGGLDWRRKMLIDLALNFALPLLAIVTGWTAIWFHVATMLVAQCFTALFAVWITHHGCEDHELVARTQRNQLINFLTYNMFFHLEHHLFPAVPVRHLPELARRIDQARPEVSHAAGRVIGRGPLVERPQPIAKLTTCP